MICPRTPGLEYPPSYQGLDLTLPSAEGKHILFNHAYFSIGFSCLLSIFILLSYLISPLLQPSLRHDFVVMILW